MLADSRSNSLIVRAANPARAAGDPRHRRQARPADAAAGGPSGNIYVVYLKNADATQLATVLRAAYASGAACVGWRRGRRRRRCSADSTGLTLSTTARSSAAPAGTGVRRRRPRRSTPQAAVSTGGFIQADPATNSLIITAPEPVYRQLRAVIDQLDSRRAQIFIESMIVEMDAQQGGRVRLPVAGAAQRRRPHMPSRRGTNFGPAADNISAWPSAAAQGGTGRLQVPNASG